METKRSTTDKVILTATFGWLLFMGIRALVPAAPLPAPPAAVTQPPPPAVPLTGLAVIQSDDAAVALRIEEGRRVADHGMGVWRSSSDRSDYLATQDYFDSKRYSRPARYLWVRKGQRVQVTGRFDGAYPLGRTGILRSGPHQGTRVYFHQELVKFQ